MAYGIFEQLAWLTTRVKRLCCAVDANTAAIAANKEANPCYLEITTKPGGGFPGSTLAYYNSLFTYDTPFTSLVIVGDSIQRLYGGSNVNLGPELSGITEITSINDGCGVVTGIGNGAFLGNTNLSYVNLPALTEIPYAAFKACTSLTNVYFPNVTIINEDAFIDCTALSTISFPKVETILGSAFFYTAVSTINDTNLPKLTTLDYAFNGSALTSAILSNVTDLANEAFKFNTGLVTVSLPKMTFIPSSCFEGCTSLVDINFPKITQINNSAFEGCTSLSSIDFPLVTIVLDNAFYNCSSLGTVNLPAVTEIAVFVFGNCISLNTVNLNSVTNLGGTPGDDNVFNGVTGLTLTLTVPVAQGTIDGGDPDGDIVYLNGNNVLAINYV